MGYFAPIGGTAHPDTGSHAMDRHLRLVHDAFQLRSDIRSMFGVTEDEAVRLLASGHRSDLIDRIYASYAAYKDMHDVVIVQGTMLGTGKLDAEIAGALNAPAIIAAQVGVRTRQGEGEGEEGGRAITGSCLVGVFACERGGGRAMAVWEGGSWTVLLNDTCTRATARRMH